MLDLIPFGKKHDVPDVFREMEKVMDRMWHGLPFFDTAADFGAAWTPRLDISETDNAVTVKAELPGLDRNDIDISLNRDMLVIKGEKKHEKEESAERYHRVERTFGSFYRAVRLPVEVDEGKIDATFKKGVLTVNLPKTEAARKETKRIKVH